MREKGAEKEGGRERVEKMEWIGEKKGQTNEGGREGALGRMNENLKM